MTHPTGTAISIRMKSPNSGYSLGLGYPYVFGKLTPRHWAVWHRKNGFVVRVCDGVSNGYVPRLEQVDIFAREAAQKACYALNGAPEGVDAETLAEIDATS